LRVMCKPQRKQSSVLPRNIQLKSAGLAVEHQFDSIPMQFESSRVESRLIESRQ